MTDTSLAAISKMIDATSELAAISKMIDATSESKESADRAIAQFKRLDDAANLIFERLFCQEPNKEKPPCS